MYDDEINKINDRMIRLWVLIIGVALTITGMWIFFGM